MENKNEWKKVKLKDVIDFNPKEILKKGTIAKYIEMANLQCFQKNILKYEIREYKGGTKFRNGDTLLARITPCLENGKTGFIDFLDENEVAFGSTEYIILREKNEVTDKNFIYYLSISEGFRNLAIKSMSGTSGRQRVQIDALLEAEIFLPPLIIQKKIAKILSDIDSKIELNNKINNNLEKQVQLIFNNHFFNKDKNYINYVSSNLLEIADFLNGLAMQKYTPDKSDEKNFPILKIKELNQGFTDKSSDRCSSKIKPEYIIKNGDIIFSWSGTLLIKIWCGNKCGLNQHLFKVTSKKYDKWFYFLWTNYHLKKFISIAKDKATTMGHIKRTDLEKSFVLIPPEKEYKNLNKILTPIFESIISNKKENNYLKHLKNYLLPKLMNGEINVENIEL